MTIIHEEEFEETIQNPATHSSKHIGHPSQPSQPTMHSHSAHLSQPHFKNAPTMQESDKSSSSLMHNEPIIVSNSYTQRDESVEEMGEE